MRNSPIQIGFLKILEGQLNSDFLDFRKGGLGGLRGISIFGPDSLTGTVSLEVSGNLDAEFESLIRWNNLQSGGSNVVIGADECVPLDFVCWHGFRLSSGTVETSDREFRIMGVEELT